MRGSRRFSVLIALLSRFRFVAPVGLVSPSAVPAGDRPIARLMTHYLTH
jgi:hypothetical protein